MADKINVSKSSKKDGQDIRVEVREIKNGFIVKKSTEGKNSKGEWEYKTEEWYSKTDPFEVTDKSLSEIFD